MTALEICATLANSKIVSGSSRGDYEMAASADADPVLSAQMLARFAERCGGYDRENRFCQDNFEELKQAGYLNINVPKEFGGRGRNLAEVCREQRRLGYHAPA